MDQPIPQISAGDVERLIARDFPPQQAVAARAVLAAYGTKDWHREPERVRVAGLKLAGGSLERLRRAMATADQDYRDVLAAAEYPTYLKRVSPTEKDDAKRSAVIDKDWKEYRAWFDHA